MLLISLIIMFVATGLLTLATIFIKKKGALYFLMTALTLCTIIISQILSANLYNNFNGYTIIMIISTLPLFLILINFKKEENFENSSVVSTNEKQVNNAHLEIKEKEKKKKKISLTLAYDESEGRIFESIAFFISAFLIAFAGLYLGKVTYFGFLIGIPFAILGICVTGLKKPKFNKLDIISTLLTFLAVGMLVGQIVAVLVYSINLCNILYSIGALLFSAYAITSAFTKERRINIILFASLVLFAISFLFI